MGQNLTGKTVSSTYQDLVQISGSVFTDGLGNNITSVDVTASYALTASYAENAVFDTGSLLTTASVSDATITFTKGNGTTFNLTTNNVTNATSASLATRAKTLDISSTISNDPYNVLIGNAGNGVTVRVDGQLTYNPQTNILGGGATFAGTASYALTASYAENVPTVDTGSLIATASISDATTTYTKADGSTFALTTNNVNNAVSASFADQSGTSGYAVNALTASYALTASSLEGGVSLQTVLDTGNTATQDLILTGTGSIDGSLIVTGSQYGQLADSEKYAIFTKQVSNSTSPNIFIGAQDPSMNGLNTPSGINNVVIGTGEFTSDVKGLGPNADNSNTIVGGWGGIIWNGSYNTLLGGGLNVMAYQGDTGIATQTQYNVILGGNNATIARGSYQAIIAGNSNSILSGSETTPSANGIFVGQSDTITGTDNAQIIGGVTNTITNGDRSIILGGSNNDITFGAGTTANSAILAGTGNDVTHQRSVVIGGQSLASTKNDEVVVPNLTISGSGNLLTFADGTTQSTAPVAPFPYTGSAKILGNVDVTISGSNEAYLITSGSFSGSAVDNINNVTGSTQVKHIAYATQAEYNAITPDDNTLYFISQSGPISVNVTEPNTASLDCSLSNMFIINATYLSTSGSITITATNFNAGDVIYIKTDDSNPSYVNTKFDPNVFTTGSLTNPDDYVIQAVSFDGLKLNCLAGNSYKT